MTRLSGWCGQLGKPDHKGCRVPGDCSCGCDEDREKLAKQRASEQAFAALAWDNGSESGPESAATDRGLPITQVKDVTG